MSISLTASTLTELTIPLACDPCIKQANSREALELFLKTSDPTHLNIPASATRYRIRALGPNEKRRARTAAGMPPVLGGQVADRLARSGVGEDGQPLPGAAQMRIDALNELTDEEREAYELVQDWGASHRRQLVKFGMAEELAPKEPTGDPVSPDAAEAALDELADHIERLSTVGVEGKGRSGSPPG